MKVREWSFAFISPPLLFKVRSTSISVYHSFQSQQSRRKERKVNACSTRIVSTTRTTKLLESNSSPHTERPFFPPSLSIASARASIAPEPRLRSHPTLPKIVASSEGFCLICLTHTLGAAQVILKRLGHLHHLFQMTCVEHDSLFRVTVVLKLREPNSGVKS